jgi:hypothetical protein
MTDEPRIPPRTPYAIGTAGWLEAELRADGLDEDAVRAAVEAAMFWHPHDAVTRVYRRFGQEPPGKDSPTPGLFGDFRAYHEARAQALLEARAIVSRAAHAREQKEWVAEVGPQVASMYRLRTFRCRTCRRYIVGRTRVAVAVRGVHRLVRATQCLRCHVAAEARWRSRGAAKRKAARAARRHGRRCRMCQRPIKAARSTRTYCSVRCRVQQHRNGKRQDSRGHQSR